MYNLRVKSRAIHAIWMLSSFLTKLKFAFPGRHLSQLRFSFIRKHKIRKTLDVNLLSKESLGLGTKQSFLANEPDPKKIKVGLLFQKYIIRNNKRMQHELEFAFRESLEMIQIPVISFDTLELREKLDAQSYLQRQILEQEITHLVLLGDSMLDDEKFISRQKLHALRADFGLIVIPVFMDCLLSTNGIHMLEFWHDLSDISIIFHPQLIPYFEDRGKRYCAWPSLPYPEIWFDSFLTATKEESLCVPGSSHRYRREWANYAERHKVPISVEINDRTNNTSNTFTLEEYFKELGKSRLVFTNGYRNRKESQVVAKVTEIMLVNSLLLYQSGSLIDFFFEPYKHYIPIHDFPDLVDKSRFLLSNPTVSEQVIRQGRNHVIQNYSTSIFWEKVFSQ